jgi:3-oxoacyl-[acyl-carrier-protein] synthase II
MESVVTGLGLAARGAAVPGDLLGSGAGRGEEFDPAPLLGRGFRYKDRSTKLALVAAKKALDRAGLLDAGGGFTSGATMGVAVSSNFGNLDTVCRVAEVIRAETVDGTSPMDLPNASSNVIASSVAIQFGLRGPNLMVCNGDSSGLDAVYWAGMLTRSGRVERALVIGVETSNPAVLELTGGMFDGAAALLVESKDSADRRGAEVLATLGGYSRRAGAVEAAVGALAASRPAEVGLLLAGTDVRPPGAEQAKTHDLETAWGPSSGALGVLECLAGVSWLLQGGSGSVLAVAGSEDDGSSSLVLQEAGAVR